jgi:hypothetical protein
MYRKLSTTIVLPALLIVLAWFGLLRNAQLVHAQSDPPAPALLLEDKGPALPDLSQLSTTTGPRPPPGVDVEGLGPASPAAHVISGVPAYEWHHGCSPTAAGMVIGYWDGQGFPLVYGDAFSQTATVNEMIASEGQASNYSDYCLPLDYQGVDPLPLPDLSEPPAGDEHPDECLADFMQTSQSAHGHYYGGTSPSSGGPGMVGYANFTAKNLVMTTSWLKMSDGTLNWSTFCAEIDAGRPMVLFVDSTADGIPDHSVTAIGYDDGGGLFQRYACLNTWDTKIHWWGFRPPAKGRQWGVEAGTTFAISMTVPGDPYEPNESPAHAIPITCGDRITATINPLRDEDYYSFVGVGGMPIVADVDAWDIGSYLVTQLTLFCPGGTSICRWSGSLDPRIDWTLPFTGTWYLMVKSYSSNVWGANEPYALTLTCVPPQDIEVTPGSLEVTLAQGQVESRTMTLHNTGGGLLTFAITDSATILTTGAELPVATGTIAESHPAVASNLQMGEFLVVWEEAGSSADIYAQRVASSGQLQGGKMKVRKGVDMEERPAVAYNLQRNEYFVVWQAGDGEETTSGTNYIYGQGLTWDGEWEGALIPIGAATDWQIHPDVAYNSQDDEYLVVWENGVVDIMGQRVAGSGDLLGGPITVCNASRMQRSPAIAYNPHANEYLVVWEDYRNNSDYDIHGCRLSAGGVAEACMQVCGQAGDQLAPAVTFSPASHEYLVAWQNEGVSPTSIYVQRVSEMGDLAGTPVDLSDTADQLQPALAFDATTGEFLVVWSEGDPSDIHARALSNLAVPSSDPFSVCAAAGEQSLPVVALHPLSGNYVVAWQDGRSGSSPDVCAYIRTSASVVPDAPWLAETPASGSVSAGTALPVWVSFDARAVATGTHMATLLVASSDPDDALITVPVTMHVKSGVHLYLAPPEIHTDAGGLFTLDVMVDAGTQPVESVELYLHFDPTLLGVVDAAGNPTTSIQSDLSALDTVSLNAVNNSTGDIRYEANRMSGTLPSGTFRVATMRVKALAATPGTTVCYVPPSEVLYDGASVVGALGCATVQASAVAGLHLNPVHTEAYACTSTFTTELQVQDVADLGAFGMTLVFDPDVVHVETIALGRLITSSARPFTLEQQIDNSLGQARLDAVSSGSFPGVSGSGPLAVITFSPVQTGTTTLALQQVQLTDSNGAAISPASEDGSATVLPGLYGDLDCDCDVDLDDVQRVADRWRSRCGDPDYDAMVDLDRDCDVDILDVQKVAYHWGTHCQSLAAVGSQSRALQPVSLGIDPPSQTATVGHTFTVGIRIHDTVDLGAFEFTLAYSPTAVEVISASLGSFPGSSGRTVMPAGPVSSPTAGTVALGAYSLGATPDGPGGEGVLAVVTLRGLAEGESSLDLTTAQVSDRAGNAQAIQQTSGAHIVLLLPELRLYLPIIIRNRAGL